MTHPANNHFNMSHLDEYHFNNVFETFGDLIKCVENYAGGVKFLSRSEPRNKTPFSVRRLSDSQQMTLVDLSMLRGTTIELSGIHIDYIPYRINGISHGFYLFNVSEDTSTTLATLTENVIAEYIEIIKTHLPEKESDSESDTTPLALSVLDSDSDSDYEEDSGSDTDSDYSGSDSDEDSDTDSVSSTSTTLTLPNSSFGSEVEYKVDDEVLFSPIIRTHSMTLRSSRRVYDDDMPANDSKKIYRLMFYFILFFSFRNLIWIGLEWFIIRYCSLVPLLLGY